MTELLCKLFVKDRENVNSPEVRRSYGTLASVVGIIVNMVLAAGKIIVGTLFGAISIAGDGINNLSDAGSQIISFISFKMAAKPADRDHPFGHGRMEYLSGLAVAMLILLMGFEMFKTSFQKIRFPEPIVFSWVSVGVLLASTVFRMWTVWKASRPKNP